MSSREDLHALLDRLPEETLPAVSRYLAGVEAGVSLDIPEEVELTRSRNDHRRVKAMYAWAAGGERALPSGI